MMIRHNQEKIARKKKRGRKKKAGKKRKEEEAGTSKKSVLLNVYFLCQMIKRINKKK